MSATQRNKGTGAGGANTNKNGLSYEEITSLEDQYKSRVPTQDKEDKMSEISFDGKRTFLKPESKVGLHKYMKKIGERNEEVHPAGGCKYPDESYIEPVKRNVFIVEKKFQQGGGSVDEKLQTGPFKKMHYGELFPNYKIHYIYCLCDWFKRDEYKSIMNYLKKNDIPVFWGSSETCKEDIIEFMHSS
jgi:hypothetical protein